MSLDIRVWVPAQQIPSTRGRVWHSGLTSSDRTLALSIIFEYESARDGEIANQIPLSPEVGVLLQSGAPVIGLRRGSESGGRGIVVVQRHERLDHRIEVGCSLQISVPDWGVMHTTPILSGSDTD